MTPTLYPLADLLTPASLARLAARYPQQMAAACRRQDAPPRWDGPVDWELERLMQERPVGVERRVA